MAVETVRNWQPQWAVPPGEILAEALEERGMTQTELARRTDRPLKTINEIIKGKAGITADTALQLELVLELPARFWLNLERDYSESLARSREQERREDWADWVDRFPLAAMRRHKIVPNTRSKAELLEALLRFFGVSSPEAWARQQQATEATFRQSAAFKAEAESVAVWLRQGELQASAIKTMRFDAARLRSLLPQLRRLSLSDPAVFSEKLVELLATVGVVLVFTPELPGTRVMGATRWLAPDRALIQLSLRYRRDDQFWFALLHELGHLLEGSRRRGYVEIEVTEKSADESTADRFASEQLIPASDYEMFVGGQDFRAAAVTRFAGAIGVSTGIVVGRLQHDRHVSFSSLNYLKQPIHWPEELRESHQPALEGPR